jgi:hypothetical protein
MKDGPYDISAGLTVIVRGGRIVSWDPPNWTRDGIRKDLQYRRSKLAARCDELTALIEMVTEKL